MATTKQQKHVLISGAGIAGLVVAFWLLRAGWRVTVVERGQELRLNGQSVDIKDAAADIVRYMGLEKEIHSRITHEKGTSFVDESGHTFALLTARTTENKQGIIPEFEIVRGDLVNVLFDAIKDHPDVDFIFGDYVTTTRRFSNGAVEAVFNKQKSQIYDLIVAADGLGSRFRSKISEVSGEPTVQSMYRFCSYFTIDADLLKDRKDRSQWLALEGGRAMMIRADPADQTWAAVVMAVDPSDEKRREQYKAATRGDPRLMKDILLENFPEDCWVLPEIKKGIENAKDLYSTEIALVCTPKLHRDGVVLAGDAGYCPTPFSGEGCTLAIIGAYVLAGEIMSHSEDLDTGLDQYEKLILPVARKIQDQAKVTAKILSPETRWALSLRKFLLSIVSLISNSWIGALLGKLGDVHIPGISSAPFKPPPYKWVR